MITTLPVLDLGAAAAESPVILPHFADGGGWTTPLLLINPTDVTIRGNAEFQNSNGQPALLNLNGEFRGSAPYVIAPRSSVNLRTAGASTTTAVGYVHIVAAAGVAAPRGLSVFSYRSGRITITEAGTFEASVGRSFRMYSQFSGDFVHGISGAIQTGLAIVNHSGSAASVAIELNQLDGTPIRVEGNASVAADGQTAFFLNEVPGFAARPAIFEGVLRVSSSVPISVTGLRERYNEQGDFLVTSLPSVGEATLPSAGPLFFPHFADSAGYITRFILFSRSPAQPSAGTLHLSSQ